MAEVPVISLRDGDAPARIDRACREHGFFSVTGHGIDLALLDRLLATAADFFARPEEEKARIAMARGGRAWRGWFPLAGELTSGVPDRKEGIYFGAEDAAGDPRPLHGPNLFPDHPADLGPTVLGAARRLHRPGPPAHGAAGPRPRPRRGSLRPGPDRGPDDPVPDLPLPTGEPGRRRRDWGVAEHTDYGLLTLLLQDTSGGLQVRTAGEWRDIPPVPGALVCNLGDMLERLTEGRYRSTPHRVRSPEGGGRLSCPFFFDPSWDAEVHPLPLPDPAPGERVERWDHDDPLAWDGPYGEYLLSRVAKVFPDLFRDVV